MLGILTCFYVPHDDVSLRGAAGEDARGLHWVEG
jgi:hypothetical protein